MPGFRDPEMRFSLNAQYKNIKLTHIYIGAGEWNSIEINTNILFSSDDGGMPGMEEMTPSDRWTQHETITGINKTQQG